MKILIIANEEWNDYVFGNGVLTNWFTGFDAEFAEVYASPGLPLNNVCQRYFQIHDKQMAKSLLGLCKAGGIIKMPENKDLVNAAKENIQRKGIYGILKRVSLTFNTPIQLIRDFIWLKGRFDTDSLEKFVREFDPDIVFCPRLITPKLMRLEKLVSNYTKAPFVAFTGDSEVEMAKCKMYTLSGIRRWWTHRKFTKHVKLYSHYLMHSADQAKEYHDEYHVETSTFFKCGEFTREFVPKQVNTPIRLVYAGRLYCNRWKSLAEIGKALKVINKDNVKIVLDIYTQEKLTTEQAKTLTEENYIYIKGSVSPEQLKAVYKNADIALHVESLDKYYREVTRVSFSTKIIDLMASSCAIMAICWNKHCGYQYLKEHDAAFCISDYKELLPQLQKISDNPSLITEYARKAYNCGVKRHNRSFVQTYLRQVFEKAIYSNENIRNH